MPLQPVVELLEDEGGEALEVGRQEVVQLATAVAREGLECLALICSGHDPPLHVSAVRLRCYTVHPPSDRGSRYVDTAEGVGRPL